MLIADYYFTKSAIFSRNTLQTDEYRLFRKLFNIVFESLPKPDLYVYLYLDIPNLMNNIRKRGRSYEQQMEPGYLEKIQTGYFDYFREVTQFPVLIIDTNRIDFVNRREDYELLKNTIFNNEFKPGITRMILP
jgi:deoxyadenosine/deoxycytidine kinase